MIVGITRVRNESLILEDTLRHFLNRVDRIVAYDDCSTDSTPDILRSFDRVSVISGESWSPNQWHAETTHRAKCLKAVGRQADMVLCFDADERLDGDLPTERGGYRFSLFDGYMTRECREPYINGWLQDLPRMWGPEKREILMFFDPRRAIYDGPGRREPIYDGDVKLAPVKVRHYGKCLSVHHWEQTCDFYARYFPQWAKKWRARKGKAIHDKSDFGRELVEWSQLK